jgi:heme exporter protein B
VFVRKLVALLKKDFAVELRTKETLSITLGMALLLGTMTAIGVNSAFISIATLKTIFPTLFVLTFLFSSTLTITRSFEYEYRDNPLQAVIMTGVSPQLIYLSKFLINSLVITLGLLVTSITFSLLLNVDLIALGLPFAFISVLMVFGFVGIATLLIPITFASKLRGVILPMLLLPLLFPILFAGLELLAALFEGIPFDMSSPWVSLLIGFDVLYVALGMNLFEHVVTE